MPFFVYNIKNEFPFDNNDSFDKILLHPERFTPDVYSEILDVSADPGFNGMNVDSVLLVNQLDQASNYNQVKYHFKILYTKNGINYENYDTILASCPTN